MRDGKRMASWAILGLAGVMVATALLVAGGPLTARAQHRDSTRISDLMNIWWHVSCQAKTQGNVLPEAPAAAAGCGGLPRLEDPVTRLPYRYERLGPQSLRLCAALERPELQGQERARPGVAVPEQPGCFDFALPVEAGHPPYDGDMPAPAIPPQSVPQAGAD